MRTEAPIDETVRRAMHEVQRYLADQIPPLMVAESFGLLLRRPPSLGATAIEHWLDAQLRAPDRASTVSGYLYHAVKKLHMLSELDLLDRAAVRRYVSELSRLVVALCPERERVDLKVKLGRLGEVETTLSAPVRLLNREKGSAELERAAKAQPTPAAPASDATVVERRLNVLLRTARASDPDALAHLVSRAVVEARDGEQLDAFLKRLPGLGIEPRLDRKMFRLLGDRLPAWEMDPTLAPTSLHAALPHLLRAMHRIVALAASKEQGLERFADMVYAAVEKLNEGHLAQAVAMLDVAERLIDEKQIDPEPAHAVRVRAQGSLALGSLRQLASSPAKHGLLGRVLRFFPDLAPENLLARVDGEPKRETRKLILALLEVHGPAARSRVLDRLAGYLSGAIPDPNGFYCRNAVYLLRRITRASTADEARELELLSEYCRPRRPFLVAREALGALGQLALPRAGTVLAERLDDFEREALASHPAYVPREMADLLDAVCAALARIGTRDAVRRLIRHAFRREAALGDTLSRLGHLAGCDLGRDPEQVLALVEGLRQSLPARILGIVMRGEAREPLHIVRALSGTSEPTVVRLFQEIVLSFPGRDFARQAEEALARFRSASEPQLVPREGIGGDLDVFGLPTLFQSLADSESTGRLVISEGNGSERGSVLFSGGKIAAAQVGRLRGLDAVCQLFERPRQGLFHFERRATAEMSRFPDVPLEVLPTVLEAIRRHDELQGDSALVPDGSSLAPTSTTPVLPEGESDRELVRLVWHEASSGTAPESCEGRVAVDAYRVRRLYAHWVEQGALERRRAA